MKLWRIYCNEINPKKSKVVLLKTVCSLSNADLWYLAEGWYFTSEADAIAARDRLIKAVEQGSAKYERQALVQERAELMNKLCEIDKELKQSTKVL